MSEVKVSHRYALSLLEDSLNKKNLERVQTDMQLFSETLDKNSNLVHALDNPVVRPEVKRNIVKDIFEKHFSKETIAFLDFVIDKGRENLLQSISEQFLKLVDDYLGIAKVKVNVAYDFSAEQKKMLTERLSKILNKKVELTFSTDPDIIGGFVAQVGDTLYDASISHQLDLLRKEFVKGSKALN
jgi:F-type H+-transporting ATPase subunit delta